MLLLADPVPLLPEHTLQPVKRLSTGSSRAAAAVTSVGPLPHPLVATHTTSPNPPTPRSADLKPPSPMNIDMSLATSYKPVLVCIVKVCTLMVFHYASAPVLFATERYALIIAALYVDKWLSYEYIVNTNSCTAVLAGSLLVHELRDTGIQERTHGEFAHNVVLAILVACNVLVLLMGENRSLTHMTGPLHLPASSHSDSDVDPSKRPRQQHLNLHSAHHSHSTYNTGALICVLCNSSLLAVLSTCAMPVNAHDPVLNNIRVWSFMALTLSW